MKTLRLAGLTLAVLVALFGFRVLTASAQGPVAYAVPINAPFVDNQAHTISPNQFVLNRFDYVIPDPTSRPLPLTTIRIPNGLYSGLNFEVWTSDEVTDMVNNHPVGRGSPERVRCNPTENNPEGWCTTGDMIWLGAFGESGAYYIRVLQSNLYTPNPDTALYNNFGIAPNMTTSGSSSTTGNPASPSSSSSAGAISYKLIVTGDAIRLGGSPIAVTGPQATPTTTTSETTSSASSSASSSTNATTNAPTPVPTTSGTTSSASSSSAASSSANASSSAMSTMGSTDDPKNATAVSGSQQVNVPANSAQWYSFTSTGSNASKTISLTLGAAGSSGSTGSASSSSASSLSSASSSGSTSSTGYSSSSGSTSLSASAVKLEVYGPDVASSWPNSKPIDSATMQGNTLSWTGSLSAAGTYYVRVINNASNTLTGTLTVQ